MICTRSNWSSQSATTAAVSSAGGNATPVARPAYQKPTGTRKATNPARFHAGYGYLFPGEYLRQSGYRTALRTAYLLASFTFFRSTA